LGTGFFVYHRIVRAVKRVEFLSDRVSYIVLRWRWCNIIVLNVHAPNEDKSVDLNAKVGRENNFKQTIGNQSLYQDSHDNGVRIINDTSKNLVVKSTMFPHRNIHKYTWTSPDGQSHNQTDHVLIDRRWHSSILDVRSFRGADCDTDLYLVVANVRERLPVRKQAAHKFDGERFNLRKLNDLEVRKEYQIEIINSYAALEN
jgi:hypothetical protein